MTRIAVWSDVHCPWAAVTVHRLRRARAADGLDVVFDQRAWPLELVNGHGIPYDIVPVEAAVLASAEPELFSAFGQEPRPSTALPAFELIAAARRAHGVRAAEDVDYYVRLGYFRDGADISIRAGLWQVLLTAAQHNPELDVERILEIWEREPVRADVLADHRRSGELPIQGSPQVFWPDGSTTHNPGMTEHTWVRGIPQLGATDPEAPGRLLRTHLNR